jgi:hypothetical protein
MKKYCRKCKSEIKGIEIFDSIGYICTVCDKWVDKEDRITLKEIRKEKLKSL